MRALVTLLVLGLSATAFAQPPRDAIRSSPGGTARITGTITSADAQRRPLRRARVMLNGELPVGRTAITNDDGTFAFDRLPAGRYTVAASKDAYVAMSFGARRSGRPGTSIVLRDGEARNITIRIPRGGVISGAITGANGEPAAGVSVTAWTYRYLPAAGGRRPASAALSATTDDRGEYRIFGLAAGEYVVAALVRSFPADGDLQVLSDAEIRGALASVRDTGPTRARPGIAPLPAAPVLAAPRRTVVFAPVFYPGTANAAHARTVTLGVTEERHSIDFQLDYAATAKVSGTVSEPASLFLFSSAQTIPFDTVKSATADVNGSFTFNGVPPGAYTVMARVFGASGIVTMPGGAPAGPARSATTEIFVDGDDIANIALALQPGLTISGRVAFEGGTPPPPDIPGFRLSVPATLTSGVPIALPSVQLDGGGRFTISGIVPGIYRLGNAVQGLRSPVRGWWLKSVVVGGRDVLDGPIELRQSADDAVVTLSDHASELIGKVTDSHGSPAPDYYVIVFGVDKASWFVNSRRVAGLRPAADGRYAIRNLPPGDYFVIAFDDVEPGEWYDPTVLERLAGDATRITLGDAEKKSHDIVVAVR